MKEITEASASVGLLLATALTILDSKNNVQVHEVIKKKETQRLTLYQGSPEEKM